MKLNKNYTFLTIALITLIINVNCKGKGQNSTGDNDKARSIFVKGTVFIINGNKQTRLRLGAFVKAGESVKTVGASIATLQLPDKTIIKVLQDSEANFKEILNKKNTEIINKGGQIFARVDKLRKGNRFQVRTVTSVAGVRGTEFLSEYSDGISRIHVRQGKVSVKTIKEGNIVKETEKILTSGAIAEVSTADVKANKKEVKVRIENQIEKVLLEQIQSGTTPVEKLAKKTNKDLEKVEKEITKKQFASFVKAKITLKKVTKNLQEYQEKVLLINKPRVTLVLKNGSKLKGHIVSQNAKFIKLNIGNGKIINIEKRDIIRRE